MPKIKNRLNVVKDRFTQVKSFPSVKIEHKDVFSWEDFYNLLHEWMSDKEFAGSDEDFGETFFLQRDSPMGKELWIRWRVERKFGQKGIVKHLLDIDIHVLGLKEVEIISEGKKKKAEKGEVTVEIRPTFAIDFSKWKDNFILEMFQNFIINWFYRKQFKKYEKELFMDLLDLQNAIKAYFKLADVSPEHHYRPVKG